MSRQTRTDPSEGGFLARWSRRKLTPEDQRPDEPEIDATAADTAEPEAVEQPATEAVDESELSDGELLVRYELPDPESLTVADDVSAFMRAGIPSRLRNLALRRMWKLHPVLANLDGLVEYNDDYTDAATVIPNLKTTYQVGRGAAAYLQDALEKARLAGAAEEGGEAAAEDQAVATVGGDESSDPADAASGEPVEAEAPAEPSADEAPSAEPVIRRRHMVFSANGPDDDA